MSVISDFVPKLRLISGITNSETPTVTTTEDHGYLVGDIIRLVVPLEYGMYMNYVACEVLNVPSNNTFTVNFDTSCLNTFSVPAAPYTQAQVIPIAGQSTDNIAS